MKKKLFFPFLVLTSHISYLNSAFSQSTFQISYDYDGFDIVNSVKNTSGGYIAAGWAYGSVNFIPVGLAIETDLLGNIVWARRYTANAFFAPLTINDMQKTSAGGYITTGVRDTRALLMNLSSAGTVNWARGVGNNNDWGNGLKQTSAGDFVVAGATSAKSLNPNKDSTSIFVFKSNSVGTFQWGRSYTLTSPVFDSHDAAYDVVEVSGGYVFIGYHSENNAVDTTTNILLFKTDASGTLLWMKSYGELGKNESGQRVIQLPGGDLLLAGYTDKTGFGDIFLIRTDASGTIVSSSAYNVGTFIAPEVNSLVQTSSGEFAVFGWTATAAPPLFAYKPFLLKLNSSLGIQFTKHYNSQIGGFFVRGEEATNGGYIIGNMVGSASWDLNLIKTDPNGISGCNENNYSATTKIYSPPTNTIAPTVHVVGSSSNFTPGGGPVVPTPTVVCATTALASNAGSNVTICNGGSASIGGSPTASGGTPAYTYAWTPGTGLSCTNCANPTASPATTTTYTVTVTDGALNTSSSAVTVFVNPTPTASAGTGTSICPGGSAVIGGSPTATGGTPGYNYAWTPSASLNSSVIANPTASPAVTTTYTVVVTDALGCTSASQVTVNVFTAPLASISGNTTICTGQSTTLTASGGGTYLWNTSATTPSIVVNPAATTTYTVTVTDANGCTNSANTTVTVNSLPIASISGSSAICAGDIATLTASGGTSYSWWNNGATSATITDAPSTTASYTVTVSNGSCSSTTTATVTVNSLPSAAISGNTNICQGETTTLTASGGGTYLWDNSATTVSITVNPATTTSYTVTVTNGSGCTAIVTATVFVAPPPVAFVSGNDTICAGQSTILTASGGLTYSWNTTATTASITVSPAVSTTYSVIVSAGSCSDTTSIAVTVNPSPAANINTASTTICSGNSATLIATGGGTYSWSTGATTSSIIVAATAAATYSVVVSNGLCADTASVNLTVSAPVTAGIFGSASTICSGTSVTLTASGGNNYSWNTGATASSIIVSPPTGTTIYTVTVSNGSCSDDTSISITVNPSPTASVSATSNSICAGDNATITATGGGTYLWNPGGQTTNIISVSPATTTSYTVTVTAANGCTASAISSVTVMPIPTVVVSANTTICSGDAATLTASGGATYLWNPGGQTDASIVVSPSTSTNYTVTAANGNCIDTASVFVTVNPSPTANAGTSITINYGDVTALTASGGGTYSWSTNETTSAISVSPTVTTIYCVTVTGANGCTDVSCVTVTIEFNCGEIFIPNAFSPNGDMKNDYFRPRNICFKTFHLVIYDRWGVKVYDRQDDTIGWDGMYKGKIGETAVFSYYFSYELVDGKSGVKKGNVSLVR